MEKIFERFTTYKIDVEGRNERSVNQYIRFTKEFCKDMGITDSETFINTKAQVVRDWLSKLASEKENSPSSRNNKLTAIKEVFKFLSEQEHSNIDSDILKIKFAKVPQRESIYLTVEEMESLIYVTSSQITACGIAIIRYTGIRFNELIQITCTDIKNGKATITGKGNKQRTIHFPKPCIKICETFMNNDRRRTVKKYNLDTDLLFIGKRGKLLVPSVFWNNLRHFAMVAGLENAEELSAHKLRHSYITAKLEEGNPIQVVRDAVGHENIATTNRYAHANEELVKRMMLGEYYDE